MLKKIPEIYVILLGNLIPFLQLCGLVATAYLPAPLSIRICLFLAEIYLLPPLLCRLLISITAKGQAPPPMDPVDDHRFRIWYLTSQLQVLYGRFPFLEEILRMIPLVYSFWLRLWGAQIGKHIFWAPQVEILDRPHLEVGDRVIVGYGALFTAHLLIKRDLKWRLLLSKPVIENDCVVGGKSILAVGARVAKEETFPAGMLMTGHFEWRNNHRQRLKNPDPVPNDISQDQL